MERLGFTLLFGIVGPWLFFKIGFELISSVAPGSINLLLPSLVILAFTAPLILLRLADIVRHRVHDRLAGAALPVAHRL